MAENNKEDCDGLLQRLQCQFLCSYSLNNINWQQLSKYCSWEQQKHLLDSSCAHPLNRQHPVKIGYQLQFLKRLIQHLEQHCTEIHDELFETYCELQQKASADDAEKFAYKHYLLPQYQTQFTLRESKSFVAEGTTGLCSWQASLALADYLLHNSQLVEGKSVLELGAGTGLCGFIILRCCDARQVCLTDGSLECVQLMRENVLRNFPNALVAEKGTFAVEQQILNCQQLSWNAIADTKIEQQIKPNIVLAADVVYDTSVVAELSQAIDFIFKTMTNKTQMLLAATVRNVETLAQFLKILDHLKFTVQEEQVIPLAKSQLFWDRSTPVKIFLITRNL